MARTLNVIVAGFASTVALISAANAQALVTSREVSLTAANTMAMTAVDTCRKNNFRISVTVVDSAGNPRVQLRDDGALPHTVDAAFKKAYTARTFRQSSADFTKATETATGRRNIVNIIALAGGLPIKIGEDTVGGIGVAGAPGANGDESCAQSGIDKVKDQLK